MEEFQPAFAIRVYQARFAFEYLGESLDSISDRLTLPLASLQQEALQQNWRRQASTASQDPVACLPQPPSPGLPAPISPLEALAETTTQQLDIIEAYRLQHIAPLTLAIEQEILRQVLRSLKNMSEADSPSILLSKNFKELHSLVTEIQDRIQTRFTPEGGPNKSKDSSIQVNIQNNIQ